MPTSRPNIAIDNAHKAVEWHIAHALKALLEIKAADNPQYEQLLNCLYQSISEFNLIRDLGDIAQIVSNADLLPVAKPKVANQAAQGQAVMPEGRFTYDWDLTWPDVLYDYSARDGEIPIGRVYLLKDDGSKWRWSMHAQLGNRVGGNNGVAAYRDEACRRVEDAYRNLARPAGQ